MLLALDLGTNLGYAVGEGKNPIRYGTHNLANKKGDGAGMRFLRFRQWLDLVHVTWGVSEIGFELVPGAAHVSGDAAHAYGGYTATLQAWAEEHKIPYAGYGIGAIKKHATGKGNAKKDAMVEAAERDGFTPDSDNAADAIHLFRLIRK